MELIATDFILSLDDIRALHAGAVLPIPRGATVLVSQVWLDTMEENETMEGEAWEKARDAFWDAPREHSDLPDLAAE